MCAAAAESQHATDSAPSWPRMLQGSLDRNLNIGFNMLHESGPFGSKSFVGFNMFHEAPLQDFMGSLFDPDSIKLYTKHASQTNSPARTSKRLMRHRRREDGERGNVSDVWYGAAASMALEWWL